MKFELVTVENTDHGVHVKVLANDKEVGILYLSHDEVDALLDLIRHGAVNSSTEFKDSLFLDSLYDEDDDS
ncbi:hypothetical protein EBR43_09475 [bacterium]|nr:hypothetical protein [bacterium]